MAKRSGRLNSFLQETTPPEHPFAKQPRFPPRFVWPVCGASDGQTPFQPALQTSQTPANVSPPVWRQKYKERGPPVQGYRDNSDDCRRACPLRENCPQTVSRPEKFEANGLMSFAVTLRAPGAASLAHEKP